MLCFNYTELLSVVERCMYFLASVPLYMLKCMYMYIYMYKVQSTCTLPSHNYSSFKVYFLFLYKAILLLLLLNRFSRVRLCATR